MDLARRSVRVEPAARNEEEPMHRTQIAIRRTLRLAGALVALAAADSAWAQCTHWNLAADFKLPPNQANPSADACGAPVWSFLATPSGSTTRDPSTYRLMTSPQGLAGLGSPAVFSWGATNDFVNETWLPAIGVNASGQDQTVLPGGSSFVWPAGKVLVHPGSSSLAVIGWTSPVTGVVKFNVTVSKMDPRGNGIGWTVDENGAASSRGVVVPGATGRFSQNVVVTSGDVVYVAIDPNGDFTFDSTQVDIDVQQVDTTPPTTSLALAPPPNAAGWNSGPVTATLTASDNPGGAGVAQITYSAAGAANVPSTSVPGATASFTDSAEGRTTVSFFATDAVGNAEAPKTATIQIDETAPVTTATAQAGTPVAGMPPATLNVTSVTVNGAQLGPVTCFDTPGLAVSLASADALSGVAQLSWSLAGAQVGAGQVAGASAVVPVSAAGTATLSFSATDVAGNAEAAKSVVVFVPKGLPVACAATSVPAGPPPHGTVTIQGTLTTTVNGFTRTFPFNATFTY
jgi:hypothetical protein